MSTSVPRLVVSFNDDNVMTAAVRVGRRRFPPAEARSAEQAGRVAKLLAHAAGLPRHARHFSDQMRAAWKLRMQAGPVAAPQPPQLIDAGKVVRPEQFYAAGIAGLSIPVTVAAADGNRGEWRMYIQRPDPDPDPTRPTRCRRECLPLGPALPVGADPIYFDPLPPPPAVNSDPRWSRLSRDYFLTGSTPGGALVFDKLIGLINQAIDFSSPDGPSGRHWATVVAAWVALTYAYAVCDTIPYLLVNGTHGSGKTRLLELLAELCFRPLVSSNITGPTLFHTLHERGGTLLLDEAEEIDRDLNNVLLAGYRRFGRCARLGENVARYYDVFGPKAIAAIEHPGPVLASRCIPLTLLRRPRGLPPLAAPPALKDRIAELRDDLHQLALCDLLARVAGSIDSPDLCDLEGRSRDVWGPIYAVLPSADYRPAVDAVCRHVLATHAEERLPEGDLLLLSALRQAVRMNREASPAEVLGMAQGAEPDAIRGWTPRKVGEALRRYGLEAGRANGRRRYRGLSDAAFAAIEQRFGADIPALHASTPATVSRY